MILQMGPMWVLAGISGGWLAHNFFTRGGYGLITDMLFGLGGSIAVGLTVLALTAVTPGMVAMFVIALGAALCMIMVQRLCWRTGS